MLLSIVLELDHDPRPRGFVRPSALRGVVYTMIERADAAVSRQVHEAEGERPFTVAMLPEGAAAAADGARLRVTGLTEETSRALATAAGMAVGGGGIRVGRQIVRVRNCVRHAPPWAEAASYEDLAGVDVEPRVTLAFVTPTAFSQGGDRHLPLPLPDLLVRGWARRWNRFAPEGLTIDDATVADVEGRIAIASAAGATQMVDLGPGKMVGSVGEVTLEALRPREWPPASRQAFATLIAYSRFCGSGARTTQGMGLTLPKTRPGPDM